MLKGNLESERLYYKKFNELTNAQKKVVADSWANPINARYNSMNDPYKSVEEMCTWEEPTSWGNYYRVAFLKENDEIVGTCRFGKFYQSKTDDVWDFGFNVVLKHWFKAFGSEILHAIIEKAKEYRVRKIRGGADIENFGSYKAMVRNGFVYTGKDEDGDYEYYLDLSNQPLQESQKEQNWAKHLRRAEEDFGKDKFDRLMLVNAEIAKLVARLQQGDDENALLQEYFDKLDQIEPFKFS